MLFRLIAILTLIYALPVLGQEYESRLGERVFTLEELFYDDFSQGYDNWVAEGNAEVSVHWGWLDVDASRERGVAATIWCKERFAGPQLVEYDVRLLPDSRASNVNMFLLADSNPGDKPLLETSGERTGDYGEYHVIPNYLVTILNGTNSEEKREMLRLRIRLDPGFELTDEGWFEPLIFGKVYHVAYVVEPPKLSVYLDGRLLKQTEYKIALESGYHGLRIWSTHSIYDNFRVSRIKSARVIGDQAIPVPNRGY